MEREKILKVVVEIIAEKCEIKEDTIDESKRLGNDLEVDSLGMVLIEMEIEEKLDIEFKEDELREMETVGEIVSLVEEKLDQD